MIEALLGAGAGVLTVFLARIIRGQRWVYSIGLLVLPTLYAIFGLRADEPGIAVKEVLYGIPFLVAGVAFALVSVRHSATVVGMFWMLHGLYDLTHDQLFTNSGVPAWYPVWCGSVDIVVGAYLLWLSRRIPGGNLRRA